MRPDGKISLSFYGDVYVAGLTITEVKEKVVLHLRKYLRDEILGLIQLDEDDGTPLRDPKTDGYVMIEPRDTDRVFVDVSAYNSKNYYVQGEVVTPGRMSFPGQDRILDAISYAGGLTADADHDRVFLYRERTKDEPAQTLRIDIDQIMLGDDLSTNYQLLPGDKLVVRRREGLRREQEIAAPQSPTYAPRPVRESLRFNRGAEAIADKPNGPALKQHPGDAATPVAERLEKRISEMERKLDVILESLKRPVH